MSHQTQAWPASVALPSFCVDIHAGCSLGEWVAGGLYCSLGHLAPSPSFTALTWECQCGRAMCHVLVGNFTAVPRGQRWSWTPEK